VGRTRASVDSWFASPVGDLRGTIGYARKGLVVDMSQDFPTSQNGLAEIRDADGNILVSWTAAAACAGLSADCRLQYFDGSATNGDLTVFAVEGNAPDSTRFGAIVALGTAGEVLWQRAAVGARYSAIAVDDSGIAFVQQEGGSVEAVDRSGVTLYELAPSTCLEAAFGRVYRCDHVVRDARDGMPALTLPFDPSGAAVLTASRIVVADASGDIHSLDLATGQPIWSRTAKIFAGAANDVVLLVGADERIHVVGPDGGDRVSCSVLPDPVVGMALVGSQLVVGAGIRLGAFDLR
jgi:outer membrane protein assembly factor BamB